MDKNVGGKLEKIGLIFFAPKSSHFLLHKKIGNLPQNKKFLNNFADTCCVGCQKTKKMHFLDEVFKKIFFLYKIMRLKFSPEHMATLILTHCTFHQLIATYGKVLPFWEALN